MEDGGRRERERERGRESGRETEEGKREREVKQKIFPTCGSRVSQWSFTLGFLRSGGPR